MAPVAFFPLYATLFSEREGKESYMFDAITKIDFQILDFIQAHFKCGFFDRVLPVFTMLGDPKMFVLYCVILIVIKKTRKDGIIVTSAVLSGALICNVFLKLLVRRDRPCWIRPDFPLLIKSPSDFSFPSGHTMAITAFSTVLIIRHPKLAWGLVPATLLMMFSRMYLFVHFPSDVLFAFVAGIIVGLITCRFDYTIPFNRSRKPSDEK